MILHINDLLNIWAEWIVTGRKVVGLSYPSQCAFTRMAHDGGERRGAEFNEDAFAVERAVQSLPRELKNVIMTFYLRTATVEQMAQELNCSRVTLYARLHRAQTEIMGMLQDMAAGVEM